MYKLLNFFQRNEKVMFYLLLVFHIGFIWLFPYYLTQDGPSHLYNAEVFKNLIFSDTSKTIYHNYFELNSGLTTNFFSTWIIAFLLTFLPPVVAEKLFLSFLIVAVCLAFRYTVKKLNNPFTGLATICFVLATGFFFHYGFYNFQLALAVFLVAFTWVIKSEFDKNIPNRTTVKIGLISLVIYVLHPFVWVQYIVFLMLYFLVIPKLFLKQNPNNKRFGQLVLWLLPSIILFVINLLLLKNDEGRWIVNKFNTEFLVNLFTSAHLNTFETFEKVILFVLSLGGFLFIIKKSRVIFTQNSKSTRSIIGLLIFNLFLYLFVRDSLFGGAYLTARSSVFILLSLFFIFIVHANKKLQTYISIVLFFSYIFILYQRFNIQNESSKLTEKFVSTSHVLNENSTILFIEKDSQVKSLIRSGYSKKLDLMKHISGYLAVESNIVTLDNYEANTAYFPVKWQKDCNPYINLCDSDSCNLENNWNEINLNQHILTNKCPIDYLLFWGNADHIIKLLNKNDNFEHHLIYSDTLLSAHYFSIEVVDSINR